MLVHCQGIVIPMWEGLDDDYESRHYDSDDSFESIDYDDYSFDSRSIESSDSYGSHVDSLSRVLEQEEIQFNIHEYSLFILPELLKKTEKQRCILRLREYEEELIEKTWHPSRVEKWCFEQGYWDDLTR